MKILRPLDWITRFTRPIAQPQGGFDLLEVIQPVLDVSCDWPLVYQEDTRTGTLAVGTNNFDFYPGEEPTPLAYPSQERRHHAKFIWAYVSTSLTLPANLVIRSTVVLGRIYNGSTATTHYPLEGWFPLPYVAFPNFLRLAVTGAAGTETYTIRFTRWDRPQAEPIII